MLRTVALILLPIALLAAACGGSSDGATRESDEDSVEALGPAGPDGIYNTADDNVPGDASDVDDPADAPASFVDLQEASDGFGMEFADLEILNADGLGDGGFGMHMEIDFGALFSVLGAPEDDSVPTGIAMDMYAFAVRDQVLVLMVMWPTGESPGVDALALAQIMASRAQA